MPVWLDTLICQMMEKKKEQRPAKAEIIAQTLGSIQEKVEAQHSAGVDAVRGRKNERPKGAATHIAEEDKAAARVLAGKGKKKKKKENVPFYQAVWFQASCIVALLSAIGLTLFLLLRPPPPEKLYERAAKLMESENEEDWDKARDGPIKTYLAHYGQRPGEQTKQIKIWSAGIDFYKMEGLMQRYLQKKASKSLLQVQAQNAAQEKGFNAIDKEDEGDLEQAKRLWSDMTKEFGSGSGFTDWGTLAGQHVTMLDDIKDTEKRFVRTTSGSPGGCSSLPGCE